MKGSIILTLSLAFATASCNETNSPTSIYVNASTFITVLNKEGNNLLDSEFEVAFDAKEIKIFYIRNGEIEEFYNTDLDWPRNFHI